MINCSARYEQLTSYLLAPMCDYQANPIGRPVNMFIKIRFSIFKRINVHNR